MCEVKKKYVCVINKHENNEEKKRNDRREKAEKYENE